MAVVQKNIRVMDIISGSVIAKEEGWLAVAELTSKYEALLTKLAADAPDTGGDSDYATADATKLARRVIV